MALRSIGLQSHGTFAAVDAFAECPLLIIALSMAGEIEIKLCQAPVCVIVVWIFGCGLSQQNDALLQLIEILAPAIELISSPNQRCRAFVCRRVRSSDSFRPPL